MFQREFGDVGNGTARRFGVNIVEVLLGKINVFVFCSLGAEPVSVLAFSEGLSQREGARTRDRGGT